MVARGCILKDGIGDGCQRMYIKGRNRRWLPYRMYIKGRNRRWLLARGWIVKDGIGDGCQKDRKKQEMVAKGKMVYG